MQFGNHAFKGFDTALQQLINQLLHMGALASAQMALLSEGLASPDSIIHQESKHLDQQINEAEIEADRMVADMLGKYSPAGQELRFLLGAVKVASSMELLADHMKNCSKRLAKVSHPLEAPVHDFLTQAIRALQDMVPLGLQQVAEYQDRRSQAVLHLGAQVQYAYRQILQALPQLTIDAQHSQYIVLVAKNLDQAGDKIIDILKIAHFIHTGARFERR